MRLHITLCSDQTPARVPINYNWQIASAIYAALDRSSSEFAEKMHNDGIPLSGKRFKLFTFSQLFAAQRSIERGWLTLHSPSATLQVSSPLEPFIKHLLNGLLREPTFQIADARFHVVEIQELPEPDLGESMRFRCLSPITVSTHIDDPHLNSLQYCRIENGFYPKVVENLKRKYTLLTQQPADDLDLTMSFDQRYIDEHGGRITKLIDYKGTKIFGYLAPFTATGSVELMRVGYGCGFGDGNSKGLGMVGVI